MWIRVALDREAVHKGSSPEYTYVEGKNIKEIFFDDDMAKILEQDGFLLEMWTKMDAVFDWGDCDYFLPEKCKKFKIWLEHRLTQPINEKLKQFYKSILDLTILAIKYDTGMSFDF